MDKVKKCCESFEDDFQVRQPERRAVIYDLDRAGESGIRFRLNPASSLFNSLVGVTRTKFNRKEYETKYLRAEKT